MSNGISRWAAIASLAALAVLVGIGAGMLILRPQTVAISSGTLLKTPRPIAAFTLVNANGAAFTKADFDGHWTLIFPGFTFCPDVCPTTLAELKAVRAKLGDATDKVRFMFLSVDPERDTPEKIAKYLSFFSPDFVGATGTDEVLEKLGREIGYVYAKVPGATPESYTIDHSTALILINPQGQVAGYFTLPFVVDSMATDLIALAATSP